MSQSRKKVSVGIDTETTGLEAGTHEIVELSVQIFNEDFEITDRFSSYIKPMRPELADPIALEKNGLDLNELKSAPTPQQIKNAFYQWHEEVGENSLLVPLGHNYIFDHGFLKLFFGGFYSNMFYYNYEDTLCFARGLERKGKLKTHSFSLVNLCRQFNIKHNAHSAVGDVEATIELYKQLLLM